MSLLHAKHERFFNRCLTALPSSAASEDSNKLAIIFFCLQGLQLLKKLQFTKRSANSIKSTYGSCFILKKIHIRRSDPHRISVMLAKITITVAYLHAFCIGEFNYSKIRLETIE